MTLDPTPAKAGAQEERADPITSGPGLRTGGRRFDCIVFDWDGTLMDSAAAIAASIRNACADLGLPIPSEDRARHVIGLGLADALAYAVPSMPADMAPRMAERYRHHYLAQDADLVLFDGAAALVTMLKEAGLRVAVATGKTRVGLDRALAHSGIAALFDATRCADESRSKPDPRMLLDLSVALGVPCSRMLVVGDTTHDLMMASNAGAAAVAVSYGAHHERSLEGHGALAICGSVPQLRAWLVDALAI